MDIRRPFKLIWFLVLNAVFGVIPTAAFADTVTIGSNLSNFPNGSVCRFQALEPQTHTCTIGQVKLLADHTAPGGVEAPFDGVIVRWSVVGGIAPAGTETVKLALRLVDGPGYLTKGPQVDLPLGVPGTRHSYPERMPIGVGQRVGVKVWIANGSTQEAGAPIAFRDGGVGVIDTWSDEPLASIWDTEQDVELLLDAELEPDADEDGYGDLTQDCDPSLSAKNVDCVDRDAPLLRLPRFAARQAFLRSGIIQVRVASSETALATAAGRLEIKGHRGSTYRLRGAQRSVEAGKRALLHLRVGRKVLKAARASAHEGKKIRVTLRVNLIDPTGNKSHAVVHIWPPRTAAQDRGTGPRRNPRQG